MQTSEGEKAILDLSLCAQHMGDYKDDPDMSEYLVPVRWLQTVSAAYAVAELGFFGNQNTVCKPTKPKWRTTVDRLKEKFPKYRD